MYQALFCSLHVLICLLLTVIIPIIIVCSGHRVRGLHSKYAFSYSSGGRKSKIEVLANLVSGEDSLPGLQKATSFLTVSLYGMCAERKQELSGVSP